jgi:hypothetical protein
MRAWNFERLGNVSEAIGAEIESNSLRMCTICEGEGQGEREGRREGGRH